MTTKSKITDDRCEVFYAELHALLIAGLDFSHTFALLIQSEREIGVKALLGKLYNDVVGGAALWEAMERSTAFRSLDCGVMRIGEQTGRLPDTLDFLRDYYRKRITQRRLISSALSYPLVILSTAIVVVAFMLTAIVPMFEQVYARMGGELPVLTRWIISFSGVFPLYIVLLSSIIIFIYILLHINRNRKEVQLWVSVFLLRLPIVGEILRKHYQAQFCKLLFLLTSSGIPLLSSIRMLTEVIGFFPYRRSFEQIVHELEQGELFSVGIARFPDLYDLKLIALIHVGEETNRLPEVLCRQGETLSEELEHSIKRIGILLEPALILLVGLLVAVILVAMYMPMFKLGGVVG